MPSRPISYPFSSVVLIERVTRDGLVRGSAWPISKTRLVTAAHTLMRPPEVSKPPVTSIEAMFWTRGMPTPRNPSEVLIPAAWVQRGRPQILDFAILVFDGEFDTTPLPFIPSPRRPGQVQVNVAGYDVTGEWQEREGIAALGASGLLSYQIATFNGQSGCPVFATDSGQPVPIGMHQDSMGGYSWTSREFAGLTGVGVPADIVASDDDVASDIVLV